MHYSLRRHSDNAGDSGGVSLAVWEEDGKIKTEPNVRPRIGICIQVGSAYARSMQWQDWWQTSYITKILSDTENEVIFETGNSTYTWKVS
jgi:hypothetical protein